MRSGGYNATGAPRSAGFGLPEGVALVIGGLLALGLAAAVGFGALVLLFTSTHHGDVQQPDLGVAASEGGYQMVTCDEFGSVDLVRVAPIDVPSSYWSDDEALALKVQATGGRGSRIVDLEDPPSGYEVTGSLTDSDEYIVLSTKTSGGKRFTVWNLDTGDLGVGEIATPQGILTQREWLSQHPGCGF